MREIRSSKLFCVPAHGYVAVLGGRETLLENAPAEFDSTAGTSKTYLMAGLKDGFGPSGLLNFATTLLELYDTMYSNR